MKHSIRKRKTNRRKMDYRKKMDYRRKNGKSEDDKNQEPMLQPEGIKKKPN